MPERSNVAVVIPVKSFTRAKRRLATVLDPAARAELARSMATTVVLAAGDLDVVVVCDDDEVATWALEVGARVLERPGRGLDGAVADGVSVLAGEGVDQVIVAHADLPHATDLTWVGDFDGITLVPDRIDDGTNVMSLPARCGFTFAYGPGSFARHFAEAHRLGLATRVVRDERLGWDVDVPADLPGADEPLVMLGDTPDRSRRKP